MTPGLKYSLLEEGSRQHKTASYVRSADVRGGRRGRRGRKSKARKEEEGEEGRGRKRKARKEEEGRGRKKKEEEGRGRKRKEEEGRGRRAAPLVQRDQLRVRHAVLAAGSAEPRGALRNGRRRRHGLLENVDFGRGGMRQLVREVGRGDERAAGINWDHLGFNRINRDQSGSIGINWD
eukprot:SAG31_NODE_2099_length_6447_cov_8.302615_1_plen_178_part_00